MRLKTGQELIADLPKIIVALFVGWFVGKILSVLW